MAGKNTGEQVHLGAALWNRGNGATGPIRARVDFGGVRPEDVRLYAVYLDPV